MSRRRRPGTDWSGLTRMIETALARVARFGTGVRVEGRLRASYEGLCHDHYLFVAGGRELVLRLGKRFDSLLTAEETRERMAREMKTLRALGGCALPHRVPELVCAVEDEDGTVIGLIESVVSGVPLSVLDGEVDGRSRLEVIAEVAARVHALPTAAFGHLPASADSRAQVDADLAEVPALAFEGWPIARVAREWIEAHADRRPATVLHGDLLPQNVLRGFEESGWVGVIDWECARIGDPAYDLAIVTRGARQPQKEAGGRERIVARYNELAVVPVTMRAVQIHEVILHLRWLGEAAGQEAAGKVEGHGPQQYAQMIAGMLRRFEAKG